METVKKSQCDTYYVTADNHAGWAIFYVDSAHKTLSIVSDFGNYGHYWPAPGDNFKKFLISLDNDYLSRKLADGQNELDLDRSKKSLRDAIVSMRHSQDITKEVARQMWEEVDELDEHIGHQLADSEVLADYDLYECITYRVPQQITMLLEKLWPAFVAELKRELA